MVTITAEEEFENGKRRIKKQYETACSENFDPVLTGNRTTSSCTIRN